MYFHNLIWPDTKKENLRFAQMKPYHIVLLVN